MANSCDTVRTIKTGDGTTTLFSFTFTYDIQSEVNVSLWDTTIKYYVPIADDEWSFANATTVSFNTAPPALVNQEGKTIPNIKIWRRTDLTSLVASFYPGSAIRAQDLNQNFDQLLNALQEERCTVPEAVFSLLDDYWNKNKDTITSTIDWVSSDGKVATTAAIEAQLLPYAFPEAPTNGKQYGRQSSSWTLIDGVKEAPENDIIYGRKNEAWVEVPTGGGSGGTGQVNTIVAGDDITVDANDAINPKVSVTPNSFLPYNISTLTALP